MSDWRTKAMKKVKDCTDQLSIDLREDLQKEISGGRGLGKGWGEIYRWSSRDGQTHFRNDRHAFVKAVKKEMEDLIESTYDTYSKDSSKGLPSTTMSIDGRLTSLLQGKDGVNVVPSATITVGSVVSETEKRKAVFFRKRSRFSG